MQHKTFPKLFINRSDSVTEYRLDYYIILPAIGRLLNVCEYDAVSVRYYNK